MPTPAAHGYAPPCLAAILYPAVLVTKRDGTKETLYGALYVLHKATKDLVSLLDDETARLREAHTGRTDAHSIGNAHADRLAADAINTTPPMKKRMAATSIARVRPYQSLI